jgi:16S rRNA (guanine527-N7)-methyltransferase
MDQAGSPGLVLAIALPDGILSPSKPPEKKTRFKRLVARLWIIKTSLCVEVAPKNWLTIPSIGAIRRGYGPSGRLAGPPAELCIPFLRPGAFSGLEKPALEEELTTTRKAATLLGCEIVQQVPYQIALPSTTPPHLLATQTPSRHRRIPGQIVILRKTAPTPDRFPRALSALRKRPLGC